jgi:hypothetical protein
VALSNTGSLVLRVSAAVVSVALSFTVNGFLRATIRGSEYIEKVPLLVFLTIMGGEEPFSLLMTEEEEPFWLVTES